ncbi:hypothetical protein B5F40_01735 [Gordonibacter sp. An230]|uniref:hypothetical protein n=1 Tax=Gordonibacter sp. An230 TaxID=1965592 RepID=UPI000B3871F7|nr:hypothetical protein [Gordonibacter sp. An230]OUO92080.1 hypothetical protein B5F40_01735 [Gordonibacter sp. An230]
MTAGTPAGGATGIGSVTFEQLGEVSVEQNGRTVRVTGALNDVEWPEFSSEEKDRTGFYVPLTLKGTGYVGKTTPSGAWKVSDLADCADGWIVAVSNAQKSFTFRTFADRAKAEAKQGGMVFTVDLSDVSYE